MKLGKHDLFPHLEDEVVFVTSDRAVGVPVEVRCVLLGGGAVAVVSKQTIYLVVNNYDFDHPIYMEMYGTCLGKSGLGCGEASADANV